MKRGEPTRKEGRTVMLEKNVIGNKEWAMGVLTASDIRMLEDFDCEMRIRFLQQKELRQKTKTYEQLVEEHGDKVPTQCEHGIPLNRKCGICRALLG
jgi:hypothetical protein